MTVSGWTRTSVERQGDQSDERRQARAALWAGEHSELLAEREILRHEILAGAELAAQDSAEQDEISEQAEPPCDRSGSSLALRAHRFEFQTRT